MSATLAVLLGGLGGLIVALGVRGRRLDNHPWCRRCRFDLYGTWPASQRCPECGADLTRIGSLRIGQRRARSVLIAIGAIIIGLAAATGPLWHVVAI